MIRLNKISISNKRGYGVPKKITLLRTQAVQVKVDNDGDTEVHEYRTEHALDSITYRLEQSEKHGDAGLERDESGSTTLYTKYYTEDISDRLSFRESFRGQYLLPGVLWKADGETDAAETTTHLIYLPPEETLAQWAERIEPRITLMSRCFADGLPSQYARLSSLTQKIHSSGIGEEHRHGKRYDSAANVGQHAIGFLRWQFEKLRDGVTEDVFKTKEELEADLATLEGIIGNEEWVKDFYLKHNSARWSARSTRGIIHLPNSDFDFGEKIHDTFRPVNGDRSFTRSGPSEEVEEAARKSEAELATICEKFGDSLHSRNSELVTERTVAPEAIVQPTHNANLGSLVVAVDTGSLELIAPFNSGHPNGFAPDRTEYSALVPAGKTTVGIVASPEHSGATVTGTGDVAISGTTPIIKNIVVTSEDTYVTKTYEITLLPQ